MSRGNQLVSKGRSTSDKWKPEWLTIKSVATGAVRQPDIDSRREHVKLGGSGQTVSVGVVGGDGNEDGDRG